MIYINGIHSTTEKNDEVDNALNSLPFMTFWCKIMTKTKFEL